MRLFRSLSGRLLGLTVLVVMLVEVAIFVPSLARFRLDYLSERVVRARIASLSVLAAPDAMVTPELQQQLLEKTGARNIVLRAGGTRILILSRSAMDEVSATVDLRGTTMAEGIWDAFVDLAARRDNSVIRVIGSGAGPEDEAIEITLDSQPLRQAMIEFGGRILGLSLAISVITAAIIFLAMRRFVVAPLLRVAANVRSFQENPEDPNRVIRPSSRIGELAAAENALEAMQKEVQGALRQRARLASLGEALAKISHDLRNMLSTGHLMADRLEMSEDPLVARTLPKLIGSLDRAISLCQRTLDYGKAEEVPPVLRQVRLRALVTEVAEGLGLGPEAGPIACRIDIPEDRTVIADPEQLYRVFANLMRNAAEAIGTTGRPGEIGVSLSTSDGGAEIRVRDTGPGMPAKSLENLFQPFRGGGRRSGAGLGLAIAYELVAAHGGRLELVSSTTQGTEFSIRIPNGRPAGC